ncbi:hypothetical protein [Hyalangium rubrum]|uniref:Uncharacterized protein n=1 Tax=Hyalangium rubrum TaxID=3103134 RepID=A0ABU5H0U7_9BACT|nr:hypothetical protein [Hyalangium sp. s54d21]MDY7227075.1 hypothetical protein [Hyalangium sp. s54d21]
MKTLALTLLFILSLVTLLSAARADALSQPRIESRMARPLPLPEGDDKDDDKKDDEEDEEEYRGLSSHAALELVDPGGLDDVLRLRLAARLGP